MNSEKNYLPYDPEMSTDDFIKFMKNASTKELAAVASSVRLSSKTVNTDGRDIDRTLWLRRYKKISAAELLRKLVLWDNWAVLVESEDILIALKEDRPTEWLVQVDNSGVRRLFVFTGAGTWENFVIDKCGGARHANGTDLFASMDPSRFDFLCINPNSDTAVSYGKEHFAMLRDMAKAVEVERALLKLRSSRGSQNPAWSMARNYQNYILPVIYDNSGKFSSIAFAPDGKNRRLVPIFTARDNFFAFYRQYFDSGQGKELRIAAPHKMTGEDLFAYLSQMTDIDGIVFNCVSDIATAFSPKIAQAMLDFTEIITGLDQLRRYYNSKDSYGIDY